MRIPDVPTDLASTAPCARADELRRQLVADLEPVRPVRLHVLCAALLGLQAAFVLAVGALFGVPLASFGRLADPSFAVIVAVLAGASAACAVLAARTSLPGRFVPPAAAAAAVAVPLALACAVVALSPWGADWRGLTAHVLGGLSCTGTIAMIALPAWAVSVFVLRRLAPLSPLTVGVFAGATAMLQGALVVQMMCPNTEAFHLALSHFVPVSVVALVTAAITGRLLGAVGPSR